MNFLKKVFHRHRERPAGETAGTVAAMGVGGRRPAADAAGTVATRPAGKATGTVAAMGRRKEASPLCIEGVAPAPMTAVPDDAEVAAAALLAGLSPTPIPEQSSPTRSLSPVREGNRTKARKETVKGSREYYEQLAEKIREGHKQERRAAMRWVTWCEKTLSQTSPVMGRKRTTHSPSRNGGGSFPSRGDLEGSVLAELDAGLLKHQVAVERDGGELLRRWQRCLAEVTIRQMRETPVARWG